MTRLQAHQQQGAVSLLSLLLLPQLLVFLYLLQLFLQLLQQLHAGAPPPLLSLLQRRPPPPATPLPFMQALVMGLIVASLWATITPSAEDGRQVMSLAALSIQVRSKAVRQSGSQAGKRPDRQAPQGAFWQLLVAGRQAGRRDVLGFV